MHKMPVWQQFPYTLRLVSKYVKDVFPQVDQELARWRQLGSSCPDQVLAQQALASIDSKRFHAQGGSIYALYPTAPEGYTRFVVALQTISDYLDNLCDRVGFLEEKGFRQVHQSLLDALDPARSIADYYSHYPHREDGGYLRELVLECRRQLAQLPSYRIVKDDVLKLAELYCDLQTYKHLDLSIRQQRLEQWAKHHEAKYPQLTWWEFSAATGSTLGIFILGALAADPELTAEEAAKVKEAYFPWICGLHILLDYFIDQEEDMKEKDLNFVSYYLDKEECGERLNLFLVKGLEAAQALNHRCFHYTVIQGLLAMYLSDGKSKTDLTKEVTNRLLHQGGNTVKLLHQVCSYLRKKKII